MNETENFWVVVCEHYGDVFCTGVFKTFKEAVGQAYVDIAEFAEQYSDDGDDFSVSPLLADDYGGYFIEVSFRDACWSTPHKEKYYILEGNNRKDD